VLTRTGGDAEAVRAVLAVEETGRGALVELRRLLGVLRAGDAPQAAQPGLDLLPALVGSAGRLEVTGDPVALPAGMDVAAYRVVQEALTNARRHAPGAPVSVQVTWAPRQLRLQVRNPAAAAAGRAGHGLLGMRERVEM
jgi:signal transduction histidine kinase